MALAVTKQREHQQWTGDGKPHPGRRMSEQEFVEWVDSTTLAEWVDGEVIIMSPVTDQHDDLTGWLRTLAQTFVEEREAGRVKGPEFMVRLPRQRRRRMPDLLFVQSAREHLIRTNHVEGAPDLIVEVVSQDSIARDWRQKYLEYERAGVREYWIIDPMAQRVEAYESGKGSKYKQIPERDEKISSAILAGFYLRPRWLFARRLPRITSCLREMGIKL